LWNNNLIIEMKQVEGSHGELVKHDPTTNTTLKYLWNNTLIVKMKQLDIKCLSIFWNTVE
jgi:hypothetical protein